MKKYKLWSVLCHASIVLSVVFLVLFVIDRVNPAMGFIGSDQGDWLLLLFIITALLNGIFTAVSLFRHQTRAQKQCEETRQEETETL